MAEIVLTTLNAKYLHASFGLRYLMANLGDLRARARLAEFDIHHRMTDAAEALLADRPRIIGLGVYIWNAQQSAELAEIIKRTAPDTFLVLGGPEVSYETGEQRSCQFADYIITGEADLEFAALCRELLEGRPPAHKIIAAPVPALDRVALPYELYDERDIATRVIYVEASRGCPFTCEFCLSSLDIPVRTFPLEAFLGAMERLLERGARQFKFVDRTFNLNLNTSRAILEFFLERYEPGLFLHFEMIPDRLPEALRAVIARFPAGALQFEVGIQTFNPEVGARIQRRQDVARLEDNLRFLRTQTGVHVHADLIAGLPGEAIESIATGFDRLAALRPQEIQLGILKRLRGTPIIRHDAEWGMIYHSSPPYELLCNKTLSFEQMQRLRRFARHWDLTVNSGNFAESAALIWEGAPSVFEAFSRWSGWLYAEAGRNHAIALNALGEYLFRYLTAVLGLDRATAANTIWRDYLRTGRSDKPAALRPYLEAAPPAPPAAARAPKRQARHLAANARLREKPGGLGLADDPAPPSVLDAPHGPVRDGETALRVPGGA